MMLEERANDVARCGQSEEVCPLGIGADDVGLSRVATKFPGPAQDEAAQASNAVGWCWISRPTQRAEQRSSAAMKSLM